MYYIISNYLVIVVLTIILILYFFIFVTNPEVRKNIWFRWIYSKLSLGRFIYKFTLLRVLIRAFPKCCKESDENPLPSGFLAKLIRIYGIFQQLLSIYRMFMRGYDSKYKDKQKESKG